MEKEKTYCDKCKKEITDKVKYSSVGIYGWYCSSCYFKGQYVVNDDDLKPLKVKVKYN